MKIQKFEKHTRVVNSAAVDEGHDVSEAEAAIDDEAAGLLGVLQPVLVARQVGGRRSKDALESGKHFMKIALCKTVETSQIRNFPKKKLLPYLYSSKSISLRPS